jgi:phosphoribosyl 1,2-cyclic phosphate phosphodiesterase
VHNKKILIDTGPDLRLQFLKYNLDDVDLILFTHEHNDHTAGLDDIRPINFKHEKTIQAYAQPRVVDILHQKYDYAFDSKYAAAPKIQLFSIDAMEKIHFDTIEILPIEIMHGSLPILGYRIGSFAYLTDVSDIHPSSLDRLHGLDVVVLSALQLEKHFSHFSLYEAIEMAKRINAKSTYFIHMSHTIGEVKEWSKILPPQVYPSYDGLEIDIMI